MHWQTISPESIRWKWIEVVTANHPNAKTIPSAHGTNWDLSNSKHKDSAIRIIRNKHTLFNLAKHPSHRSLPSPSAFPRRAVHLPSPQSTTSGFRASHRSFRFDPLPYHPPLLPTDYRIRTCMIYAIMISDSFLFHFKQRKTLTSLIVLKQIQQMMRWDRAM